MHRRSLLKSLASALLALPLLRRGGGASAPSTLPGPALTDRYAAWLKAQTGSEYAGPPALSSRFYSDAAPHDGDDVLFGGERDVAESVLDELNAQAVGGRWVRAPDRDGFYRLVFHVDLPT